MTNKDRGVIKWTSMMLPEHVQRLKDLSEKHKKKEPPTIDSQVFEEWSSILAEAYYNEHPLFISVINDGGIEEDFQGYARRIDQIKRALWIETVQDSERICIPFSKIIHLSSAAH